MSNNVICICPSFLVHNIQNYFTSFFLAVAQNSNIQISLDKLGELRHLYLEELKHEPTLFELVKTWFFILDKSAEGNILLTDLSLTNFTSKQDLVFHTIKASITTFDKKIITHDNTLFQNHISVLRSSNIHLLNPSNCESIMSPYQPNATYSYVQMESDLEWILHRLSRSIRAEKNEDEYNDYLRDMFLAKNYYIKDQTREGVSASGKGAGEVDLLIEKNKNELFYLMEALKLSSVDKTSIKDHFTKLLKNYNPLALERGALIIYYTGSNMNSWWDKYAKFIKSITSLQTIGLQRLEIQNDLFNIENSEYQNLKRAYHHISINNQQFIIYHIAIQLNK